MGVDHGRLDAFVPQKLLDGPDVVTTQQEMGGEAVTKGVAGGVLGDPGLPGQPRKWPRKCCWRRCVGCRPEM
jgi:hypothetical protein